MSGHRRGLRLGRKVTAILVLSALLFGVSAVPRPALAAGSDLRISGLIVIPTSGQAGSSATVSLTIYNQGSGAAGACTTNIRINTSTSGVTTSDPLLASVSVPSIGAGLSWSANVPVTIPAGRPAGTNYVWAIADVYGTAGQTNETNDYASTAFTVTVPAPPPPPPAGSPDLVISGLSVSPSSGLAGSPATVGLNVRNQGTATAGASTTNVRINSSSSGVTTSDPLLTSVSVPSLAAGASWSTSLSVTIPAGRPAGTNYVWAIADVSSTSGQTNEANDYATTTFTVTTQSAPPPSPPTPPAPTGTPDLVISGLAAVPSSGQAGSSVTVSLTIYNQGSATAGANTTNIRINTSAGGVTTSDTLLTSVGVPSLAAGASWSTNAQVTIPAGRPSGTNYIWAIADVNSTSGQTNETNDYASTTFTVTTQAAPPVTPPTPPPAGLPDLVFSSLTVNPPGGPTGSPVTVNMVIRNQGAATAAACLTNIRINTSLSGVTGADPLLTTVSVPSLPAGASWSSATQVTIPAGRPSGTNYIWAIADVSRTAGQADEANDYASAAFTVTTQSATSPVSPPPTGLPDLVVSSLTVSPSGGPSGSAATVTMAIRNQGTAAAAACLTNIRINTSPSGVTGADPLLTSVSVPALAAGASWSTGVPVTIPAGRPSGTNYIWAIADVSRTAGQADEGNDYASAVFTVAVTQTQTPSEPVAPPSDRPDLVISNLAVSPGIGQAGAPVTVSLVIRNQGTAQALPSVANLRVNGSPNGVTTADQLLTSVSVPAIAVNASWSTSLNLTIPVSRPAGTSYVWAIADVGGTAGQADETNDYAKTPFTVLAPQPQASNPPDLVIQSLTVGPSTAAPGTQVTVALTIRNQGMEAAGANVANVRVNTSPSGVTTSDALLTSVNIPSIPAGGTRSFNLPLTVPADRPPGPNYVWAIADVYGTAGQSNESNDKTYASLYVMPDGGTPAVPTIAPTKRADLVVESLTVTPAGGLPGSVAQVGFRVTNKGTGRANTSKINIRMAASGDRVSPSDPLLISLAVPALEPGASFAPGSQTITIPVSPAGLGYVWAIADVDSTAGQSDETNDWAVVPFSTASAASDLVVRDLTVTPTIVAAGSTVTISFMAYNQGKGTAKPSPANVRLSPSATSVTVGDPLLATLDVPQLAPGGAVSLSQTVTIPSDAAGARHVWVILDVGRTAGQIDETNDLAHKALTVTAPPGTGTAQPAAIRIDQLKVSSATPTVGQAVTVTARLTNTGTKPRDCLTQLNVWSSAGAWGPSLQDTDSLTLQPGQSTRLTWTFTPDKAGPWGYQVAVLGHVPGTTDQQLVKSPSDITYLTVTEPGTPPPNSSSAAGLHVAVNGEYLSFENAPIVTNGRTEVEVRRVGEALGATVRWDPETQTVYLMFKDAVVRLTVGEKKALVNDKEVVLDEPAQVVDGRVMVPLRFLSELRDSTVTWDQETGTVSIVQYGAAKDELRNSIEQLTNLISQHQLARTPPSLATDVSDPLARNLTGDVWVDRANELFWTSQDWSMLAYKTAAFARDLLDRGSVDLAQSYLQRAWEYETTSFAYYKASQEAWKGVGQMAGDIAAIKVMQVGVHIVMTPLGPLGQLAAVALDVGSQYVIDTQVMQMSEQQAQAKAAASAIAGVIFTIPAVRDAIAEPIGDYVGRGSGLYQRLGTIIDSPEVKAEIMKAAGNLAEEEGTKVSENILEEMLNGIADVFIEEADSAAVSK